MSFLSRLRPSRGAAEASPEEGAAPAGEPADAPTTQLAASEVEDEARLAASSPLPDSSPEATPVGERDAPPPVAGGAPAPSASAEERESWIVPVVVVLAALLLAGAAFYFALNEISKDAEAEVSKAYPTQSIQVQKPKKPPPPKPSKKAARPPAPQAAAPPGAAPQGGAGRGGIQTWPAAQVGYTVIIRTTKDPAEALAVARAAVAKGIPAGVLRSDDFASLEPGNLIVFAGRFSTREQALAAIGPLAQNGFPGGGAALISGGRPGGAAAPGGAAQAPGATPPGGAGAPPGGAAPQR